jgi:hypothetical protein
MQNLIKRQVYSGILEIINDKQFYYHSNVSPEYCHFTDEGINALVEYMQIFAPIMLKKEKLELEKLAKDLVWKELNK